MYIAKSVAVGWFRSRQTLYGDNNDHKRKASGQTLSVKQQRRAVFSTSLTPPEFAQVHRYSWPDEKLVKLPQFSRQYPWPCRGTPSSAASAFTWSFFVSFPNSYPASAPPLIGVLRFMVCRHNGPGVSGETSSTNSTVPCAFAHITCRRSSALSNVIDSPR